MKAQHTDIRQHILDTGKAIITRKGFAGVGLNEILSAADVPKGSFYHYFKSKELFGEAMLADYVTRYLAQMDSVLSQPGQTAAQSLMDYWASWSSYEPDGSTCDCRCLVVKLSSEVADISEAMRVTLLGGTNRIVARLAVSIEQAAADGSLSAIADPAHTALTLYQMWLGAALLTKLRRDASALQTAWQATLNILQLPADRVAAR